MNQQEERQLLTDIALIKDILIGDTDNGRLGICKRVSALEESSAKSSRLLAYFTIIGTALGSAVTYIIGPFINK